MFRKRRNTYRRPHVRPRNSNQTPAHLTLSCIVLAGLTLIGSAVFFNFLAPDETLSSIDPVAQELATRKAYESVARHDEDFELRAELREPKFTRLTSTIQPGDTPSTLLEGHLGMSEIYALCAESRDAYSLDDLKVGQPWTMVYFDNALVGLEYEINPDERLVVTMSDMGYEFRREAIPCDVEVKNLQGTITGSLFKSILDLGESESLAVQLANVFAYDVDFVRDLRTGDTFQVVIEKRYREGAFVSYGNLLAASFTNQGHTYYAYRYVDKRGNESYYDEAAKPLRKAFLKAPLPFTRISSGYTLSRMHPILKYRRPHQGVDYAAPTGTPISTVADGLVADAGFNNSQGRYVRIAHRNGYETIYNHMSKFAKAVRKGVKVTQGQVIGYVGSTGFATGPHLDYRMKLNGKYLNPLKLKTIPVEPIARAEVPMFMAAIDPYKKMLTQNRVAALDRP